jgi:hypothetical protein
VRAFIAEERAFDAFLRRDRVVDVVSPNKDGISCIGSQDDVLAGSDELARRLVGAGVVLPIKGEAGSVPILGEVPEGIIGRIHLGTNMVTKTV